MSRKRKRYSAEFKLEAVRLYTHRSEAGVSLAAISRELEIRPQLLRQWEAKIAKRAELSNGQDVFPGNGKLTSADEEVRRLRRELAIVREERDFLKKGTAFFAKESG